MQDDVRLQRAHEKQSGGTGIADPDDSRFRGPAEIVGHNSQTAAWRAFGVVRVERHHQRSRAIVHVDGNVLCDDFLREWNETFRDPP